MHLLVFVCVSDQAAVYYSVLSCYAIARPQVESWLYLCRARFSPTCSSARGRAQDFSWGRRPKGRKSRPKAESGVVFLGSDSKSPCHRLASLEERCELPQRGSGQSPDRPKVFLASPVAYHAAIGGRDPRASPLRTPLALRGHSISVHDVTLFIQFFFSLPRALDSGVIPSRISCFRYVDFLTMCRKCCSFPCFNHPSKFVLQPKLQQDAFIRPFLCPSDCQDTRLVCCVNLLV